MSYDLVIRGADVVDGSGLPRRRADVAIDGRRIAAIGRIPEAGRREIDAEGHVVTPGFIDGHTHMDAQIFWDPLGTCSSWHGVTTVVMGNCGFTLAPADRDQRQLVIRNLERAEDISPEAMAAGIDWRWSDFASFLDVVDGLPKGINYAANLGHSALRTWVMGERAFDGPADATDVDAMERELRAGLHAGAIGFTTSRSDQHLTADGRPVASRLAAWSEVERLVSTLGSSGGIFELAHDGAIRSDDTEERHRYLGQLRNLATATGVPVTFGILDFGMGSAPWQEQLALLDATAGDGGVMFGQAHCRELSVLLSFQTALPYDRLPEWATLRTRPLDEQLRLLRDPAVRSRLVDAAEHADYGPSFGAEARRPDYDDIRVLRSMTGKNPTVASLAQERRISPVEVVIDEAVSSGLQQFFCQVLANRDDTALTSILDHPRTVMTFSDSGAHVSQIMDASIQSHLLAEWVRERQHLTLEDAVQRITLAPAIAWGFTDRGLVRDGMIADLNVLDPDTIAPQLPEVAHDLPTGARRLVQKTRGILTTVVAGEPLFEHGDHTGALPGRLLRRPQRPGPRGAAR